MNILFFVSEFPALSETFIVNQIVDLKNRGHLVNIYSSSKPQAEIIHENIVKAGLLNDTFYPFAIPRSIFSRLGKSLKIIVSRIPNTNFLIKIKSFLRNDSKISGYNFLSFLNKPKYDVVHAHFGHNGNAVTQFRKLGLFRNAKFITTFHGSDLNETFAENNHYTSLFIDCNAFTVNSFYSKNKLLSLGCPENKISVLPVGLNTSIFKKTCVPGIIQNEIRLLFVGRLIKLKGPHLFIEICKLLKEKNQIRFKAFIIGEGNMQPDLVKLIKTYDLTDVVNLRGPMKQEDVLEEMNTADVFILPGIKDGNLAEAQGLVIQEAQAMQLPVIISDAGGMKEGIIDGLTGFVIKQNNLQQFVAKVELLASDESLRKKMGEEGRKLVVENYDIEKLNGRLIQIYLNI